MTEAIIMKCPGCHEPITPDTTVCPRCDGPIVIREVKDTAKFTPVDLKKYVASYQEVLQEHPNNNQVNGAVAICMMQLGLYDKAIEHFEKAIDNAFDNPDTYYYASICLLKGQKAFTAQRTTIDKIVEYLQAAQQLEPKGIFFYFEAYIKYDFFKRKFLKATPDYNQLLETANNQGVSEEEIAQLYQMLKVERPAQL